MRKGESPGDIPADGHGLLAAQDAKRAGEAARGSAMRAMRLIGLYLAFLAVSGLFLVIEHLTHLEFMFHLAAIPLEILLAVFLVQRYLESREKKEKRRKMMFIKSHFFRSQMRHLFLANFGALKSPSLTMSKIKNSSLGELRKMRHDANTVEYQSSEEMELVIMEYVKAEYVWRDFMDRAITYDFEDTFHDMIYILNFVQDVKLFKDRNPDKLFIHEAEKNEHMMIKVRKVLGDGIQVFLDYLIELKEKQPDLFDQVISDYETSSHVRGL